MSDRALKGSLNPGMGQGLRRKGNEQCANVCIYFCVFCVFDNSFGINYF